MTYSELNPTVGSFATILLLLFKNSIKNAKTISKTFGCERYLHSIKWYHLQIRAIILSGVKHVVKYKIKTVDRLKFELRSGHDDFTKSGFCQKIKILVKN